MSLPFNLAFSGLSSGLQTKNAAASGGVGGWVELGRTTLGSAGNNINVSSLTDKRYYMVLGDFKASGGIAADLRLNTDTGNNYAYRVIDNGVADVTDTNTSVIHGQLGVSTPEFIVGYLSNKSDKEKLYIGHLVNQNTVGAGTAPQRVEITGKHAQTTNPITSVDYVDRQAGQFASGSEVVVLGWDPADTHTNNFWTELASVELGSAGTSLASGTILAKKYLWVQAYLKHTGSDPNPLFRVNGDTGSNYASRQSINGGAENVEPSIDHFDIYGTTASSSGFINMFIINNSANEKLVIAHHILQNTAGAGNAPTRGEHVIKWANTSSQITSIACTTTSNTFGAGSIIKVWGSN